MTNIVTVPYEPNAKQQLFHASPATEVVYGGAKGGGKSCGLVMEALAYGLEHPGAEMYLFRETYDDLEANIIKEWKEKVPRELYKYHESKYIATLKNGTTVKFRHIASVADAEGYQGRSIDWIGVDELTKHEEKAIQILLSCLRSAKGFPVKFRGTCNPGGIGHTWVKTRYIDGTNYGKSTVTDKDTGNTIAFIPAKVYDNDILMKNDPGYVKRLENLPENQKKAFLHGDWDIFEGQYYGEFRHDIHTIEPFYIPGHWKRFRSLDYGLDMTACYWWAVSDSGREFIYRELYESGLNLSAAAKRIVELTPAEEQIQYTVASPDLWNKRQETGYSGEEIMAQAGLTDLTKADHRRIPGWRALREHIKPFADEQGIAVATLQIFKTCSNLVRTLPQLQHSDKDPEDAANTPHEVTHGPESIRYGVMSRPLPSFAEGFLAGGFAGTGVPGNQGKGSFDQEQGRDAWDDDDDDGPGFFNV